MLKFKQIDHQSPTGAVYYDLLVFFLVQRFRFDSFRFDVLKFSGFKGTEEASSCDRSLSIFFSVSYIVIFVIRINYIIVDYWGWLYLPVQHHLIVSFYYLSSGNIFPPCFVNHFYSYEHIWTEQLCAHLPMYISKKYNSSLGQIQVE